MELRGWVGMWDVTAVTGVLSLFLSIWGSLISLIYISVCLVIFVLLCCLLFFFFLLFLIFLYFFFISLLSMSSSSKLQVSNISSSPFFASKLYNFVSAAPFLWLMSVCKYDPFSLPNLCTLLVWIDYDPI